MSSATREDEQDQSQPNCSPNGKCLHTESKQEIPFFQNYVSPKFLVRIALEISYFEVNEKYSQKMRKYDLGQNTNIYAKAIQRGHVAAEIF